MVAGAWTGMALPAIDRTKENVEKIYYWDSVVPMVYLA